MDKWELKEHKTWHGDTSYGAVHGEGISAYHLMFDRGTDKSMAEQHVCALNERSTHVPMVPGTVTISEGQHNRLLRLAHLAQTYFDMTQDSRTWSDWAHRARTVWIKNFKAVGMHVQEHKVYSAEIQTWCPL